MSHLEKHGSRKQTRSQRKRRLSQRSLKKRALLQRRQLLFLKLNQKLNFQKSNHLLQSSRKIRKRRRRLLRRPLLNQKKTKLQSNQKQSKKKLKKKVFHFQLELVEMIWLLKKSRVEFKILKIKNQRREVRHLAVRLVLIQVKNNSSQVKKQLLRERKERPSK